MIKNTFLCTVLSVLLFACSGVTENVKEEKTETGIAANAKDGVFFHISTGVETPKRALMALSLAAKFAESHDVALFFDLEGVNLITKNAKNLELEHYLPSKDALAKLLEKNVLIMACPMCVKAAGLTSDDLLEGVIIAEKEKFFNFTKGRIINLDY